MSSPREKKDTTSLKKDIAQRPIRCLEREHKQRDCIVEVRGLSFLVRDSV